MSELVKLPCMALELETALHRYGDHHGFHGTVVFRDNALVIEEAAS